MLYADNMYIYAKILPGAVLRSPVSKLTVTVTCTSMCLSDLVFVLVPICWSVSPSVSLWCFFFFIRQLVQCVLFQRTCVFVCVCVCGSSSSSCVQCSWTEQSRVFTKMETPVGRSLTGTEQETLSGWFLFRITSTIQVQCSDILAILQSLQCVYSSASKNVFLYLFRSCVVYNDVGICVLWCEL